MLSLLAVILLVVSLEHNIDIEDQDDDNDKEDFSIGVQLANATNNIHHPTVPADNLFRLSPSERKILISSLVTIAIIIGLLTVANAQT